MEDEELLKKYNSLYLEIIMQYKGYIEDNQNLYVAELPKLITPEDENVIALAKNISGKIPDYNYDHDFIDVVNLAYEYVKNSITTVALPIQFWLKPSQTIKSGAGDVFDKAVLLCSILIALGNLSTKAVIVADDNTRRFIVYSEFKDKIVAVDLDKGIGEYGNREELLKGIGIKDDENTTAYEFNDKMYVDIV